MGNLGLNFLPWYPGHPCEENKIEKSYLQTILNFYQDDLLKPATTAARVSLTDVHRSKWMLQVAIGSTSLEQVGLNILTIPIPRFSDSLVVLVSVVSLVSQ